LSYIATNDICHSTKIPLHLRQEGLLAPLGEEGASRNSVYTVRFLLMGQPKKGDMLDGSSSSKRKPK
ncbi:hypothetical protein SDD30_17060, partial [Moorella naiadis]|uniref:hypothetical protein n=1 Tax=Moorella naiadis (nom. illeg.) TaxID=3093670 RepID=UPI003D9CB149